MEKAAFSQQIIGAAFFGALVHELWGARKTILEYNRQRIFFPAVISNQRPIAEYVMKRFLSRLLENQQEAGDAAQDRTVPIATAALLLQVAGADYEFTTEEQAEIAASLERFFHLTPEEVADIVQISEQELKQRIDIYFFTSQLNQVLNPGQRLQIIEMAWRVIYADQNLSGHEDQLIHRLATLLRLDHGQLIEAKLRVKGDIFPKEQ